MIIPEEIDVSIKIEFKFELTDVIHTPFQRNATKINLCSKKCTIPSSFSRKSAYCGGFSKMSK